MKTPPEPLSSFLHFLPAGGIGPWGSGNILNALVFLVPATCSAHQNVYDFIKSC
jgi:hypothetical protein